MQGAGRAGQSGSYLGLVEDRIVFKGLLGRQVEHLWVVVETLGKEGTAFRANGKLHVITSNLVLSFERKSPIAPVKLGDAKKSWLGESRALYVSVESTHASE